MQKLSDAERSDIAKRILTALEWGPKTPGQIAQTVGTDKWKSDQVLDWLRGNFQVSKDHGKYRIRAKKAIKDPSPFPRPTHVMRCTGLWG